MKVGKTQEGGVELFFQNRFFLAKINIVLRIRVWKRSESEQSSEFECAADKNKRARERRRTQAIYTGSFHNPEVVLSPLHFQGEFH